jgi:hypothetical protein
MDWRLIASALVVIAAPTEARELAHHVGGNVIIRFRHPAMICAGVCPNYQIEIFANGDVVRGNPKSEPTDRDHLYANAVIHFRVPLAKLRQFRTELDKVRPIGNRSLDIICAQAKLPDGSPDPISTPNPDDLEVRWVEGRHNDRLTSCADGPLRGKLQSALRTLGVDPYSGKPLAP